MNTILYWTGFGDRVEIYRYVDGKIFHQYATNKLDFRYHCRGGERETVAEVAIFLFKVIDATPGRTVTPHTEQYSFESRHTRPNISKKGSSK
jgi:hypothetical protein